ncbi:MAG TPA: protein kinase [Acetobacteraceae bacterium]
METLETLGKYEIKRTLGRGAMGIVYEAWDPVIARRVAIKTVKLPDHADPDTEEALARFRREAQAAGRLTHPNIVAVFDYGETSDLAYIVMEFVDGPSLKSLLDKQERFALADAVRVMQDLLAGLQFSHERGVVHRDIKPANVMLTSEGQAKIADFGIARIESSSMTQAGTLLGTPAYMSPEQFMGQVVDARTDIYSSGVLLYQLLTGERPFEGGMSAIMHKALNTEPPVPSQLSVTAPPSFDAVVRRAMAKRPEDRFSSAKAFAEAIRAAMSRQAEPATGESEPTVVSAPPPQPLPVAEPRPARTTPAAAPPPHSRMPAIAGGVAAALLAVLGGAAWWVLQPAPGPAPAQLAGTISPPALGTGPPTAQPPANPAQGSEAPATRPPAVQPGNSAGDAGQAGRASQPAEAPPNPQVAIASLDALRRQIAQWANSRSCAVLGGDLADDGVLALNGYAGNRSVEELRQELGSFVTPGQVEWRVVGVEQVFCQALNLLHPIAPGFAATGQPRLGLQMADGKARLHDGEHIRVRLAMPDFPARLRVDYLTHDGTVQHLYPQLADPKFGIAADPPRTWHAGEQVDLGNPVWAIGEPYGTDMIIAVASSDPLFERPRPSNAELADDYLRDLQAATDALRQRGARLAGAAVTLEALPK